jgi:hypothetical protein
MSADGLVQWLREKTGLKIDSLGDPHLSGAVCFYLVNLTGQSDLAAKIRPGDKPIDISGNYQLAKALLGTMNCPFPSSVGKLVDGNEEELATLLQTLASLPQGDNEDNDDDEPSLDNFLDALQGDLLAKLRASREFRDEMDAVAQERDFYFDKLRRITEVAQAYPPDSVAVVTRVIRLPAKDFEPFTSD